VEKLDAKVAVITGAASGIGRALADACAAAGMRLALADIEPDPLHVAQRELAAAGADVIAHVVDVSDGAQVDALRDLTIRTFGAAHLVVNNAGVSTSGPVWTFPEEAWRWVLGVNLWGAIHGVRAFVPALIAQGDGHVVNTASMQGLAPTQAAGPYAVSKHGVVALSEVLRADLRAAKANVGVSVLCPGPVPTRIYESERNRPAAVDLASVRSPSGRSGADVKAFLERGPSPAAVAAQVLDAVRTNRFYVLTDRSRIGDVVARTQEIVEGDQP
jgi:NAD(P)-dependent dehydrogenase (short-subunit alcohol dehydrogenase family)